MPTSAQLVRELESTLGFFKTTLSIFEAQVARAKAVTSLDETTAWLDRAFGHAISVVGAASEDSLSEPIPDERIMQGAPRSAVVGAIADHTAHHRGGLAVYARLIGEVPLMPYS